MKNRQYDLEERLILFSVSVLNLVEKFSNSYTTKYLGNQLIRSATSPALNYGEAQAAESRRNFLHKLKICLKELRESQICLKIINRKIINDEDISNILKENGELIAIFFSSIKTTLGK